MDPGEGEAVLYRLPDGRRRVAKVLKVHHDERAEGQYTGSHRSGT